MQAPEADLTQCVRCGLCLQHCPTYVETGLETESPRGRLYIMQALSDGIIEPTASVIGHLDMCLQCRNCEAVCPSGVPFGSIMEAARRDVLESPKAPASWKLRSLFLREVVAKPGRLELLSRALRFSEQTGLRALTEHLPLIGPHATLAPRFASPPFKRTGLLTVPDAEIRARVALLTGCLMPLSFGDVHRATVRVLARNGCVVSASRNQVCCGALHAHNGDLVTARKLARRNVDAFEAAGMDTIIVNSAGCGAAMKEYGELLADDPKYRTRAERLSASVKDISEFLVSLPLVKPTGRVSASVTYQDSCHLAHAQRITAAPRQILTAIPGVTLVEMRRPDRCCGSAGVYSLTQPEMSLSLLKAKMGDISATNAAYIATSNPGCIAQLDAGVRMIGSRARAVHVIELLDRSYRLS
ncbi:MAG: heterodisulfide reductase-related iron-sulfur binding cluster [Dehalococcoidia bacterium]